jgi:hypothetical protein
LKFFFPATLEYDFGMGGWDHGPRPGQRISKTDSDQNRNKVSFFYAAACCVLPHALGCCCCAAALALLPLFVVYVLNVATPLDACKVGSCWCKGARRAARNIGKGSSCCPLPRALGWLSSRWVHPVGWAASASLAGSGCCPPRWAALPALLLACWPLLAAALLSPVILGCSLYWFISVLSWECQKQLFY